MIRLAADQNFDNDILRGLKRRKPDLDIVRAQDAGLSRAPDWVILEWAANENRILLTHDVRTMNKYANQRLAAGLPMPGICAVKRLMPLGDAIEDILILIGASQTGEWEGQVRYVPL